MLRLYPMTIEKELIGFIDKVTEIYPSKDEHVRLVKVKMKTGEF